MALDLDLRPDRAPARPTPAGLDALPTVPFEEIEKELATYAQHLRERAGDLLGYPESQWFDYEALTEFLGLNIDNLGVGALRYGVNSVPYEDIVIKDFIRLFQGDPADAWGYVTGSGSEGNLYGCYLGREALPDGVLYYSTSTHYSVAKAAKMLRIDDKVIPSLGHGEIDYVQLEEALRAEASGRRRPPIIVLTAGTTLTGAIDDVDTVVEILRRNGIDDYYIHVDAALSGLVLPFMHGAPEIHLGRQPIGSVSVSIHKFLGAPYPCGVVVTREVHAQRIETRIPYIGSVDRTIGGSRNGQAPLYLWHALRTRGADNRLFDEVARCRANAEYLHGRLVQMGLTDVLLLDHSLTVVFDEPSAELVNVHSLASTDQRAHIITVPGVTRPAIDRFLGKLAREHQPALVARAS